MTLGTIVVETPEGSGALISANHALEQDREVSVVPGNLFSPISRGADKLIKRSGVKLVWDYKDILEELNLSSVGRQIEMATLFPQDESESGVLSHVTHDPIYIDEIIRNSGLAISTVSGALVMMVLKGLVK